MPPRSYLAIAIGLAALVATSALLTAGSSMFVWHWLLAASGCILGVVGAHRTVDALGAPRWIAAAFALPALVWAMTSVKSLGDTVAGGLGHYEPSRVTDLIMIYMAVQIASLAAAAGALRLVETISAPRAWLRFGYAVLAVYAIVVGVGLAADILGWQVARSAHYAASVRALRLAATFVEYAALVGASVLVTARRRIEPWAGVVISLIGCIMLYHALRLAFGAEVHTIPSIWPQPLIVFIGGAAVWRIGALLNFQAAAAQTDKFSVSSAR